MKINLTQKFHYFFPNAFELYTVGITLLLLSAPGLGIIFVEHDDIIPSMFGGLRGVCIAWGCVAALTGVVLIFSGIRRSAMPGTLTYRLTHPRSGA